MLDKLGEVVNGKITFPFKLIIHGAKLIVSGIKDIVDGIADDSKSNKPDKTKD